MAFASACCLADKRNSYVNVFDEDNYDDGDDDDDNQDMTKIQKLLTVVQLLNLFKCRIDMNCHITFARNCFKVSFRTHFATSFVKPI